MEATPTAPPPKTSGSGSARNQDQPLPTESSQSSRNEDDLRKLSHHPSLPPPHPHHSPHPPSRQPVADHSALLLKENAALKRQLSEISFEAAHERVVLQGRLAGIEALSRRRLEEAGDTVCLNTVLKMLSCHAKAYPNFSFEHGFIFGSPKKVLRKVCRSVVNEKRKLMALVSAAQHLRVRSY